MESTRATEFLHRHGMHSQRIDPAGCVSAMAADMEAGLAGNKSSMPMIPTYLSCAGNMPENAPAVVIDAGGTNFRCALVSFSAGACRIEHMTKCRMPGTDTAATWDEFISFVADRIQPLLQWADRIGFCFSYSADITPDMDGRVNRIDKEVVISGCEGKLIGRSLIAELERRGITGKKAVILNDTVAVLLGGSALLDKGRYSGFIGQVSGTGTNTCCDLPVSRIGKLSGAGSGSMLINLESGLYTGIARGDYDIVLDKMSNNPGEKLFEKMTSGAYLGELGRLMINAAADEGAVSAKTAENLNALQRLDASNIDAWAAGERLDELCGCEEDKAFVQTVCLELFRRSARCMCVNLSAIMLLTGAGTEEGRPVCICAEGSLIQKGRFYRPALEKFLKEYTLGALGRHFELHLGEETTLPGSAAAALLN